MTATEVSTTCEWCEEPAEIVAVLGSDNDTRLCARCHADPRVPTISLAALADQTPVYVVTRADLARMAWRDVTDEEAARIAEAIGHSTAGEAVGDAVFAVCGSPPGLDPEEDK